MATATSVQRDPPNRYASHGPAPLVLFDVLRAFAGARIVSFAFRSLVRKARRASVF
jgi:hypothetical protein